MKERFAQRLVKTNSQNAQAYDNERPDAKILRIHTDSAGAPSETDQVNP